MANAGQTNIKQDAIEKTKFRLNLIFIIIPTVY